MKVSSLELKINGIAVTLCSNTTREDMISLLGQPDDVGGFSRKFRNGSILKYSGTEFHFSGDKDMDTLALIYRERLVGAEYFPDILVKFD